MTNKELMQWYMDWWKKQFPDYDRCELVENGNKIYIRVHRKSWQNKDSTIKSLKDAKYAWDKTQAENISASASQLVSQPKPKVEQPQVVVAPTGGNLNVSLTPKKEKKEAKTFKTVSCVLDMDFYNKVQSVCEKNNMNTNELIRHLLKQVIDK